VGRSIGCDETTSFVAGIVSVGVPVDESTIAGVTVSTASDGPATCWISDEPLVIEVVVIESGTPAVETIFGLNVGL
jgi:hypothetical protein